MLCEALLDRGVPFNILDNVKFLLGAYSGEFGRLL